MKVNASDDFNHFSNGPNETRNVRDAMRNDIGNVRNEIEKFICGHWYSEIELRDFRRALNNDLEYFIMGNPDKKHFTKFFNDLKIGTESYLDMFMKLCDLEASHRSTYINFLPSGSGSTGGGGIVGDIPV